MKCKNPLTNDVDRGGTLLDEELIELAAERVRRAHGLNAIKAMKEHADQQQSLVRAEAAKTRHHFPLPKVFAAASEVSLDDRFPLFSEPTARRQ